MASWMRAVEAVRSFRRAGQHFQKPGGTELCEGRPQLVARLADSSEQGQAELGAEH